MLTDIHDNKTLNKMFYERLPAYGADVALDNGDFVYHVDLSKQEVTRVILALRRHAINSRSSAIASSCLEIINKLLPDNPKEFQQVKDN